MPTLIVAAIGLTGVAASIATALIGFAISYAIQSLLAPDEPSTESPADQGVQARIPTNPKNKLPVVYGEQRVAGQNVMADISSNNQKMAFIIALSEGSVEAINRVTWEDKVITFVGDINTGLRGVSTTTTEEGETSSFLNGNFRCQVFPTGGRCAPMESFSSRWNANSDKRAMPNTAYAYVEITYNREERVTGLPSRLFFNVKGRRVDKLQSDGTFATSTTMSTNPVDNLLDFLTDEVYGCSIKESGLDLPSFYAHKVFCDSPIESEANNFCSFPSNATTIANGRTSSTGTYGENDFLPSQLADASEFNNQRDCEDATAFSGSSSVSATWQDASDGVLTVEKPRYSTNGVLNTNNELDRSISDLTVGNGGIFTYNLGKFGIVSEGERSVARRGTTAVSFSEDNIIGKIDITGSGFDAVLNECTLKFTSIRQKYQQEQVRIAYDPAALLNTIQNPNEPRLEKTMQLPFTNNDVEARRIGRIIINDSRQALIVSFQANIDNTDLQSGDIVEISHNTPGWGPGLIGDGGRFSDDTACTNAGGTVSGTTCVIDPKLFRIQQVDEKVIDQDNMSVGVAIIAREYAPEVYTSETLLLQDPAPNTNFPNPLVAPNLALSTSDASGLNDKGIPVNRIRVDWSESANLTFVDTVDVRIHKGNVDVSTLSDSDWEYYATTSDSIVISDYGSESIGQLSLYQIQVRPRNSLGSLGTYLPLQADKLTPVGRPSGTAFLNGDITTSSTEIDLISIGGFATNGGDILINGDIISYTSIETLTLKGVTGIRASGHLSGSIVHSAIVDRNGAPVETASLDSIFEVEVNLTSNTGGTVFKNGSESTEKQLKATVTKVTETDAVLKDPDTFNYVWRQDGVIICIDSSKNVVGVVDDSESVQNSQAECESAGGDWDDTRTASFMCHTTDSSGVVFANTVAGCTAGDRADTLITGYTLGSDNLDGAITAGTDITTVTVNSTADFPAIGSILINTVGTVETFTYTSTTPTTFVGLEQTLSSHLDDISVTEVYDKIQTITVQHNDVTESSGFSCEVSNIELTQT